MRPRRVGAALAATLVLLVAGVALGEASGWPFLRQPVQDGIDARRRRAGHARGRLPPAPAVAADAACRTSARPRRQRRRRALPARCTAAGSGLALGRPVALAAWRAVACAAPACRRASMPIWCAIARARASWQPRGDAAAPTHSAVAACRVSVRCASTKAISSSTTRRCRPSCASSCAAAKASRCAGRWLTGWRWTAATARCRWR